MIKIHGALPMHQNTRWRNILGQENNVTGTCLTYVVAKVATLLSACALYRYRLSVVDLNRIGLLTIYAYDNDDGPLSWTS